VRFDPNLTARERVQKPDACCYSAFMPCPGGRPLRAEGTIAAVADSTERTDWLDRALQIDAHVHDLPAPLRERIAAHWVREAAFEHASIASFARASLELMTVGAPPDLLASTHEAACDEIAHARVAFAIASAYAGRDLGPGSLPHGAVAAPLAIDVASIARGVLWDGCINESVASLALREASASAEDPALAGALARLASDEERHAELAWKTLAWLARAKGRAVAAILEEALLSIRRELAKPPNAVEPADQDTAALAEHGVLPTHHQASLRRQVLTSVVVPCCDALLRAAHAGSCESVSDFDPAA
jgi:hypothetical protein